MIIKTEIEGEDKLLLLESVYHDGGVRLIDLSDKESMSNLLSHNTKIVYRKLEGIDRDDEFITMASHALSLVLNKKYGMHFFKFWSQSNAGMENEDNGNTPNRSYHCAELVAKFYKMMDLVTDPKGSSRYLPDTFAQTSGLKLEDAATLSHEQVICFSESDFSSPRKL